jgi:hypothetical protein
MLRESTGHQIAPQDWTTSGRKALEVALVSASELSLPGHSVFGLQLLQRLFPLSLALQCRLNDSSSAPLVIALDDTSHGPSKEIYCLAIIEIKKYDVAYYAGGRNTASYPYRAIIGLRDDNDKLIGAAYFHQDSTTMPGADTQKASGYISCHYLAADYPQVLDILRNEKPVYVEFEPRAGNIANIRTSAEPVGEGEQSS